jgi:aminoglycoside phosphotransferase (APT) family kinase protein
LADAICIRFDASAVRLCELDRAASLAHGDLGWRNILAAPAEDGGWRINGLIDWEAAFSGSPLETLPKRYCSEFMNRISRELVRPTPYARIAFFALAAIGSASLFSVEERNR